MTLSYESALRLFRAGMFAALAKPFEHTGPNDNRLDPEVRGLVAHALVRLGHSARARSLVADTPERGSQSARVTTQIVLGLASRGIGAFRDALAHLQLAVRLAQDHGDAEVIAWAQLHLLRHLVDGGDAELVQAMIPSVRIAVNRAGSPQASAYLHAVIATIEGERGRLDEGWRHCGIATSVLELSPNAWLACSVLRSRVSISVSQCRVIDALDLIKSLTTIAETHSLERELVENEANRGYIHLLKGDYERSLRALRRVVDSPSSSMRARLAALESMARVSLATADLNDCQNLLQHIDRETARDSDLLHTSAARWARVVRARLLMKQGKMEEAVEVLESATPESSIAADAPLVVTLHLTRAQALARLSRSAEAARHLIESEEGGATRFRDVQGQFYYAASSAVETTNYTLALQLRDRARRLWAYQGIVSLEREMDEGAQQRRTKPSTKPAASTAISALGSVLDLAHSPRLLGQELVQVLGEIGVDASMTRGASSAKPIDGRVELSLGTDHGETVTLACALPNTPEKAVLMRDVLRVGRAAVELERYKAEERRRTALWPEARIEEQLGALFISQEMRDILGTVRRIATTTVPVLVTGETGTGKEVIARLLHAYSQRAKAPFLAFNCTSTPKDMLDSQLFGHRRGSFTGALEHFPGIVRTANHGTLLLDEIGDMPLEVQPKLLRFLESSEVHPVGESRPTRVDVRVLAATNSRLESLVSQGRFREDLYYRLNIVELSIPPLRERRVDIPSLANHFLKKHAEEYSKGDLRLSEDAMEFLILYRWPGNVRQLANEMRRIAAVAEAGAVLMPEHLSPDIASSRRTVPATGRPPDPRELLVRIDQPMPAALEHVERVMIEAALRKHEGRVEEAAAMLGLSRKGLYLKRKRYGMLQADTPLRLQA
jgi:DNA-binding NtrC family response regulator